jgi:hypothetical protein
MEHTDTDVADELAVNAEHTHAAVAAVCNSDVTVARQETQLTRVDQLTITTAVRPEST